MTPTKKTRLTILAATLLASLATLALAPAASAMQATEMVPLKIDGVPGLSFGVGASVGAAGGTAYEKVYAYPRPDYRHKLSELDWDIKDVAMIGAQGTVAFRRLRLNVGLWNAVNDGNGEMVDYDWMYLNRDWSHRSIHPDTTLDKGVVFDVNLGVTAFQWGPVTLSGILGYKTHDWKWTARGGSFIYSDTDNGGFRDLTGTIPAGQKGIVYEQEYRIPYFGVGVAADWPRFHVEGHVVGSPWVSAKDTDNHVLRDITFKGDFSSGDFAGVGCSGTWNATRHFSLTLAVESQAVSEMIGDVSIDAPDGHSVEKDGGSVEIEAANVSLVAGFRF